MKCPDCKAEMEYEEIRWPCGIWHCECGKGYSGDKWACGVDEGGVVNEYEERIGDEIK